MNYVALGIVVGVVTGVIARQVIGRGPSIWVFFLAGAFLTVAFGVLDLGEAEGALAASAPVVLFLFALFLFTGALDQAGVLDHLARWIVGRAHRAEDLPAVLFVGLGLVSAFIVNDALVLMGVPVLIGVARRLRTEPLPLLLVLAFGVTVGSTFTPFGNPQNLLISVASGVSDPIATFLRYLLIPSVINLAVGAVYLRWEFRKSMRATQADFSALAREAPPLLPPGNWRERVVRWPVLVIFPGTMIALIALGVASVVVPALSVPVWETAGAGAILLLAVSPGRTYVVGRVDWTILVLFGALFVVVGAAVSGGVIAAAARAWPIPGPGNPAGALVAIIGTSAVGSQLVSNVPWVALQIPILSGLGYGAGTPIPWMALAAGSTLAGNFTLLGAASNLIIAGQAERSGVPFRLGSFVRYGAPLAAMTLAVTLALLLVGL
jgi:Na+/H+ antiporter NhaD/arsenite permease-like protein